MSCVELWTLARLRLLSLVLSAVAIDALFSLFSFPFLCLSLVIIFIIPARLLLLVPRHLHFASYCHSKRSLIPDPSSLIWTWARTTSLFCGGGFFLPLYHISHASPHSHPHTCHVYIHSHPSIFYHASSFLTFSFGLSGFFRPCTGVLFS